MSITKLDNNGIILAQRNFPWMRCGSKDAILKDESFIIVVGGGGFYDEAKLDFLVLSENLDSIHHSIFLIADSLSVLGIRSVVRYLDHYIIVGFAYTEFEMNEPALSFWIDAETFELDSIVSIQMGSRWTSHTQAFVQDSFLILSYLTYSGGPWLSRGFLKFERSKNIIWTWESERESAGLRGEDAMVLMHNNLIIEHALDNMWDEFSLICISPEGDSLWTYESKKFPFGRKELYGLSVAQNGDILGCGWLDWIWDEDSPLPSGNDFFNGGYLFRLDSETGELLWERAIIGYDSLWNYAGHYFNNVEELSDGTLMLGGSWRVYDESGVIVDDDSWLVRTDSEGCVIPDCGFPSFTTSVMYHDSSTDEKPFILAPNPAGDMLTMTFHEDIQVFGLCYILTSIEGKIVCHRQHLQDSGQVEVHDLPSGMYLITVMDEEWRWLGTQKFVKI